jgi:hypothetical protein
MGELAHAVLPTALIDLDLKAIWASEGLRPRSRRGVMAVQIHALMEL